MKLIKKFIISILLMAFSFSLFLQCYGSFPLVRTVYNFNGSIGGPSKGGGIIRSIVMILLSVIPVYGISFFIDVIILNSIEFWSGDKMNLGKIPENPNLELTKNDDMLKFYIKKHDVTLYAFKDKPGEFFILKNNEYVSIKTKIVDNNIYLMDNENHVLISKELSEKELSYVY